MTIYERFLKDPASSTPDTIAALLDAAEGRDQCRSSSLSHVCNLESRSHCAACRASSEPLADAPPPAKDGFVPTGPRQPAPGILWPVEHWASFGADAWDLDRRCVVCGGDLNGFDHARCWPSMDAASPGSLPLDDFRRQRRADPRNSTESTESVEFDWNLIERALDEVGGGRRGRWPAQLALEEGIRKILRISTQAADNFDMMTKAWGEAHGDSRLIDAVAAAGVVVRPLANDAERFGYELPDGKPHADGHFPSWRAAALAGLARAGVQIPTRGS